MPTDASVSEGGLAREPIPSFVEKMNTRVIEECERQRYSEEEMALLSCTHNYYGRLLNPKTRAYAIENAVSNISRAIRHFELDEGEKSVLDIGCGLGMQSIIFAARGARVVGIDLEERCTRLCEKRKRYYEELLQVELNVEFKQLNFSLLDPETFHERYDCAFSKSAIAHMYPIERVVANVVTLLKRPAKVFIWDQNPGYLFLDAVRPARRNRPGPARMSEEFAKHGFAVNSLTGGCALPWYFWQSRPLLPVAKAVNSALRRRSRISFTYLLAASRA